MNLGVVASFVIGGLLLVSLLTLNSRVMTDSTKSTIDLVNKRRIEGIRQLVHNDLSRIGYGENSKGVEKFSSTEIEFKADVEEVGTKIVNWKFYSSDAVTGTKNPNDYKLVRKLKNLDGTDYSERTFPVIDFQLTGYDEVTYGADSDYQTNISSNVRAVLVKITYESAEPINRKSVSDTTSTNVYSSSSWRKFIVPNNLAFREDLNL